jgi:DNA-binding NarL/FixJ family response regulator
VTKRLLIVDDEPIIADVLRMAFSRRGWEVEIASTLGEAIAHTGAPDILLVDKNLPDGSGVDFIRHVRKLDHAVGIVMMTAFGTVESARDTLNLGIDLYLEKPFGDLFAVVDELDRLRERVLARRAHTPAHGPATLTVIVATNDAVRRQQIGARLTERVLYVDSAEALKSTAAAEKADLLIVDGFSYPAEATCMVAETVRHAACVVLSESLTLTDVKRLIQLQVKALIDFPIESRGFAQALEQAVERVRKSRALK